MIIQCDECKTKFKLDDSKIKPEGVKVKCKKCSHVFFVFPEKEEKQEEKILETGGQTNLLETSGSEQEATESWEKEIFSGKPDFEEKEDFKGQTEFDWEQFSQELKIEKTETQQTDTQAETEIKFDLEEGIKQEEKEETKEEFKEEPSFKEELNVFEMPKFDFTEEKQEEQKIDFDLSEKSEKEEEGVFTQNQDLDLLAGTGSEFVFEEKTEESVKKEDAFEFILKGEDSSKEDRVTESEALKDTTEKYEEKDKEQKSFIDQEIPLQPEDFLAQAPKKVNFLSILISILIVIIVGGGGSGYMWWQKVKITESKGSIGITNVKSKYGEAKDPSQIFIVTGKIKNEYHVPKSFLKVKCTVYGKNNAKLMEKIVFAGNIFTEAELKELTYSEIEKGLNNKMGKSMVNVDVPPGKLLDFMVVFDKLPEGAEYIEVEGV